MASPAAALFVVLIPSLYFCFAASRKMVRGDEGSPPAVKSVQYVGVNPSKVIQLSRRPRSVQIFRVFEHKDFLTIEECDRLNALAQRNNKSEHLLPESQEQIMFQQIDRRISTWAMLPEENGQPLKLMQYKWLHFFWNESLLASPEPLMAVVILHFSKESNRSSSDCISRANVSKGSAIVIFTLLLNGAPDDRSSHLRCSVMEGEEWVAVKFIYMRSIATKNSESVSKPVTEDDDCTDEDENCSNWAAIGECHRNPLYMIGSSDYFGACRKSCKIC